MRCTPSDVVTRSPEHAFEEVGDRLGVLEASRCPDLVCRDPVEGHSGHDGRQPAAEVGHLGAAGPADPQRGILGLGARAEQAALHGWETSHEQGGPAVTDRWASLLCPRATRTRLGA